MRACDVCFRYFASYIDVYILAPAVTLLFFTLTLCLSGQKCARSASNFYADSYYLYSVCVKVPACDVKLIKYYYKY